MCRFHVAPVPCWVRRFCLKFRVTTLQLLLDKGTIQNSIQDASQILTGFHKLSHNLQQDRVRRSAYTVRAV